MLFLCVFQAGGGTDEVFERRSKKTSLATERVGIRYPIRKVLAYEGVASEESLSANFVHRTRLMAFANETFVVVLAASRVDPNITRTSSVWGYGSAETSPRVAA